MSKASEFHPKLSTLDIAKFQLMENGFAGVTNGVTLIPAKCVRTLEANHLSKMITELLDKSEGEGYIDSGEAVDLLVTCKAFLHQYPENPEVAVMVVFRPSVREGEANVQPVARIIAPEEVIEPEFVHTDGAGNVREQTGGSNGSNGATGRNKGNGADT